MVEKVITPRPNVVDFVRYQTDRSAVGKAVALSARICRHCGAALSEGEREDECSSTFNDDTTRLRGEPRKSFAD
jgi:hypothetical protein